MDIYEEVLLLPDNLKLNYIKNMEQDDYRKVEIVKSIKSDEIKIEALSFFEANDDYHKLEIIATIKSDEKKIEAIKVLSNDFVKANMISTLQDDDRKVEELEKLSNDSAKVNVIITLQDDDRKMEELKKLQNDFAKADIINTLQDDDRKVEALRELNNDFAKADVIKTLEDDDRKIEELRKLSEIFAKADVIDTLQDEVKKAKELEKLSNDFTKRDIIIRLQADDIKIEKIEKLSNDYAKAEIISILYDDNRKVIELEKLSDDFIKADIINTLQDDARKVEELEKLRNDFAKVKVIITIQDDARKVEELEKLKDEFAKAISIDVLQGKETTASRKKPLLDREKLAELFLDSNRTYTRIGLDKNITIGIEIESEGNCSKIIEKLHMILKEQINGETRGWIAKGDGSLQEGVEVVSPILTDNTEDIEDVYTVCSMLKKCGQKTNDRCGGHIHIGADYLKSKEAYINLFEIWGNTEEIIYKTSNDKDTIPRKGIQQYALPISTKLNEAIENEIINLENEEELEQFIIDMQKVQNDRYSGLNILNINNGNNTIEFRLPNGTINPDIWIENVRFFGRIIEISQKLAEIENQKETNTEDRRLLNLRDKLKEQIPEEQKMELLLELLFSENERKVYRDRYMSNFKLLGEIPDEKNPLLRTKFSEVNFKKKKHTLSEFYQVSVTARIEDINKTTKETEGSIKNEESPEEVKKEKRE